MGQQSFTRHTHTPISPESHSYLCGVCMFSFQLLQLIKAFIKARPALNPQRASTEGPAVMEQSRLITLVLAGLCAATLAHNRKHYYISRPLPWDQARSYCRQTHTDLAVVEDGRELGQLVREAGPGATARAWIGLQRGEIDWRWASRAAVSYHNWNHYLFCATMNPQGTWEDTECDRSFPFMCYTDSSQGSRTYTLIEQNKTWAAARDHCRQQHTDLVTISSPRENQAVREAAL
uniref:C-type lectin domain-containing protein n=1 Tax=Lepisosteus oculatus TaxID=7918 RepID=W5M587_LEPOC